MEADPVIAELRERIAALEAAVVPQTARNAQEYTWNPRGPEPRIIDENGRTLPFQGALQFLGLDATEDPMLRRIVIKAAVALAGNFSPDEAIAAEEMLAFRRPADSVLQAALKTRTTGASPIRDLWLVNADSGVTVASGGSGSQTGRAAWVFLRTLVAGNVTTTPDQATMRAQTAANRFAQLDLRSRTAGGGFGNDANMHASVDQGTNDLTLKSTSGGEEVAVVANAYDAFGCSLKATLTTLGERVIASNRTDGSGWPLESSFLQYDTGLSRQGPGRRCIRGPFKLVVTALAAGATVTGIPVAEINAATANQRNGAYYVVVGGIKGASGCEDLTWSYADSGTTQVLISVTNQGSVARSGDVRIFVISDS